MLHLKSLTLFLASLAISQSWALTIRAAPGSKVSITNISVQGSHCSQTTSTSQIQNSYTNGASGVIGFDGMTAFAFAQPGDRKFSAFTECTVIVDLAFPIGYQLSTATAVAHGFADFDAGMTSFYGVEMWFPSQPDLVVSLFLSRL